MPSKEGELGPTGRACPPRKSFPPSLCGWCLGLSLEHPPRQGSLVPCCVQGDGILRGNTGLGMGPTDLKAQSDSCSVIRGLIRT